jgi:hypothetical protein
VTRFTNPDSDVSHSASHAVTSFSVAETACPSDAMGSLVCAGSTVVSGPSCRRRLSEANSALARSRAASALAWRSGRPTELVNSVSPVNTAASFSTKEVLSAV